MLFRFYDYYINFPLKCHKKPAQIKSIVEWSHLSPHFFFPFSFFASDDEAGKCARHVVGDVENLAGEIRMLDTCPVSGPIFKFRFTGRALPNLLSC